jgi:hypothetical protein
MSDICSHWSSVWASKAHDAVSWYQPDGQP